MLSAPWCVRGEVARITKLTQNWRVFELTKLYIMSNFGMASSACFSHNLTKNQCHDDHMRSNAGQVQLCVWKLRVVDYLPEKPVKVSEVTGVPPPVGSLRRLCYFCPVGSDTLQQRIDFSRSAHIMGQRETRKAASFRGKPGVSRQACTRPKRQPRLPEGEESNGWWRLESRQA